MSDLIFIKKKYSNINININLISVCCICALFKIGDVIFNKNIKYKTYDNKPMKISSWTM